MQQTTKSDALTFGIRPLLATRAPGTSSHGLLTLEITTTEAIHAQSLRHRRLSPNWVSHRTKGGAERMKGAYYHPPTWYGAGKGMLLGEPVAPWRAVLLDLLAGMSNAGATFTTQAMLRLGACASQAVRYNNQMHLMVGVVTGTEDAWRSMLALRLASDVDPTMTPIAQGIWRAIETASWQEAEVHAPFWPEDTPLPTAAEFMQEAGVLPFECVPLLRSAASIARISYGEAGWASKAKDVRLGTRLATSKHWSPFDQIGVWLPRQQLRVSPLCSTPADLLDGEHGWRPARTLFPGEDQGFIPTVA